MQLKSNSIVELFQLAVYLFDLFMDNHDINVDRLFLIGITCVRVVCKLEEKSTKIPEVDCIPQSTIEINSVPEKSYYCSQSKLESNTCVMSL